MMGAVVVFRSQVWAASCVRILKTSEVELLEDPQASSQPIGELRVTARRAPLQTSRVRTPTSAEEDPNATPPPPALMDPGAGSPPPPSETAAPPVTVSPPSVEAGKTVPPVENLAQPTTTSGRDEAVTEERVSPLMPANPDTDSRSTLIEEQPLVEEVVTAPIPQKITITVNAGQIYPGVGQDPTGRYIKIKSERKTYLVPAENTSIIAALDTCNEQPVCLVAKRNSFAIKNLSDPEKRKISFRRNDKIPTVASRISQKKEKYYLAFLEKDYYWVKSRDVATYTNKTCEEVRDMILPDGGLEDPVVETAQHESRYSLGFEVGYGMGYSSKDYNGFVTDVPDSSNVGPLSNPIITKVKKGQGFYLGPLLEVQISEVYKLKFGAQYQEKSYTYVGKENPTIAPNSLDSLPDVQGTFKDQSILFSVAPAYEFGGLVHRFGVGAQLRTHYYISKPSTLTYRVGSVFKATEVTIEGGPKGFQNLFLLNGYYQWHFDKSSPLRLRSTLETDGTVFNLGLAVFY